MPTMTQADQATPEAEQGTYTLCDIAVSHIVVSENNPRKQFDEQELERLAHAMSTRGLTTRSWSSRASRRAATRSSTESGAGVPPSKRRSS